MDRDSRVLDLVSYAWAGFGAAFGPVVVLSLFWRPMTGRAALCGMIVGAITVVLWPLPSGGIFELYEIVPGFLLGCGAIVLVTLAAPQSQDEVLQEFDRVAQQVRDG
ncbi:MAG: sodium/proline symporter PutP [Pseudomonadota bacterium]|jgi:sodium/proline symporter